MTTAVLERELRAIDLELARRTLLGFTLYTFPSYEYNWHHGVVCKYLDRVLNGSCRRLMLFMPPQNGKSELLSRRFPAYVLGRYPDKKIMTTSYGDELATEMSRDVQKIMDSPEYRTLFPQTKLASGKDSEARKSDYFEVVGRRGSYRSASIMGGMTGRTAELAIIDDPVKNRQDAESDALRKQVWDQFISAFMSRQFGADVPIVLCMTRWHEDDLAGRLLRLAKEDPKADQWEVVSFPALAEPASLRHRDDPRTDGQPLWPTKYPADWLARQQAISTYNWSALFQQRPTPPEGGLIKRGYWKFYEPDLRLRLNEIVISVDTALKSKETNDPSAIGVWGGAFPNVYGLKMEAGRWDYPELIRKVLDLHRWVKSEYPGIVPYVLVENTAAGPDAIAELRRHVAGVIAEQPKGEKIQRVHSVLPILEGGACWLPGRSLPDGTVDVTRAPSWVAPFVDECASFPFGTHDDQVDQMTQAVKRLHRPKVTSGAGDIPWL